jgi:glycosyltransferase involved in cell wall biosynthesis
MDTTVEITRSGSQLLVRELQASSTRLKVLLYAEVDLNLIDGSSIWLASLAELIGGLEDVEVTILQRTKLTRTVVVQEAAELPSVHFLDPWDLAIDDEHVADLLAAERGPRLSADAAAALISCLDDRLSFDVLLVRGETVAEQLVHEHGRGDRLWCYVTDPERHASNEQRARLVDLVRGSRRLLCQTTEAREALEELLPDPEGDRVTLLPPMVTTVEEGIRVRPDRLRPKLGYSGKFSPAYRIVEMLDAFEEIRRAVPDAEFHVVGDKFHNAPPVEGFVETVTERLETTAGVVWHGGLSRTDANAIMATVDVASSWRTPQLDSSLELSTKVLEYAALGIPVLMNRSRVQERVFGADYPGYVTSTSDFVTSFLGLTVAEGIYSEASKHVREVARNFTLEATRERLGPLLELDRRPRPTTGGPAA